MRDGVEVAVANAVANKRVALGPMASSLGFLLRLAQLKNFGAYYAAVGPDGPAPGAFTVLTLIDRNPGIRQGVLAQELRIKRAHMTKLVRTLVADGLVARRVPEDDRRSVELRLSEKGRRHLAAHAPAAHRQGSGPVEELSVEELAVLVRLLRKYLRHEEPLP